MSSGIRDRIERWFESFAAAIYRHPFIAIIAVLLIVAPIVAQLPKITIDTSTEGFLEDDDPTLLDYNSFRAQFGRDEVIIIALKPEDVFDLKFLEKLDTIHDELEDKVPYLDEVTSLVNARNTRGEGDELIVEDLLEDWPESPEELAKLRERVVNDPMYRNLLISPEGDFTTIIVRTTAYGVPKEEQTTEDVLGGFDNGGGFEEEAASKEEQGEGAPEREFLTDEQNSEVVTAVRQVVEKYQGEGIPIYIAGSPVVIDTLKRSMIKDMKLFLKLVVLTIAFFLFLLFRRISGVIYPLLVVGLTLLSTIGLMAATGTSIKLPTQVLPSFLLAVCVGASVHVLAIFFRRFDETGDRRESIVHTLGHSGLAITMTSLTTAGGLASFSTADIAPIADLGIFASSGVMIGLLLTLVLLPALLSITRLKPRGTGGSAGRIGHEFFDRLLGGIARSATGNPRLILALVAVLIVLSVVGMTRIKFSHNVLGWIPEERPVREATEVIDKKLNGSITLEVIVDTKEENGLYAPDVLKKMDSLADDMEGYRTEDFFVGKAFSVADILKEINQALNENRREYYSIPSDRDLIAQEFLLFENSGSDDLEDFVDSGFSKARFTIKGPFLDAVAYVSFIEYVRGRFHETFSDYDFDITITGVMAMMSRTIRNVMVGMAESYSIALVVISIMMVILIGRLRLGLLSMIPNLAPIVITMGIMGWFGFPMDLYTMLVGGIAIGLAVDDTIHFMHNFRRYFDQSGDVHEAVRLTLVTTGRAMLVTSTVLSLGFFIFMFASMNNLIRFGFLTGITILMALLSDYYLAPALMSTAIKRGWIKQR